MLLASAQQYPFGDDCAAQIDVLYVAKSFRGGFIALGMITGLRRWADNRDIAEIRLHDDFSGASNYNAQLFERLGMLIVGTVHPKSMER